MKKTLLTMLIMVFAVFNIWAQIPQGFSYQAVVRNASGELIKNQQIALRITILQGNASGTSVYSEAFMPTTNEFGLINLIIGSGDPISGDFSTIDWSNIPFFVKVEMDVNGGGNFLVMGTNQLFSVPYALYSLTSSDSFSGNYGDLIGAPTNVSAFINDAGYLTNESDPVFNISVANGISQTDTAFWNGKSDFSGNYPDLSEKPEKISDFILDASEHPVSNVADPVEEHDAVNKAFLNMVASFRVSLTGDTLFLGNGRFVIIPGVSNANQPMTLPVVITTSVTEITAHTAVSGGEVTEEGGTAVTARGICWSTIPDPTLNDSFTTDGTGVGPFVSQMTDLLSDTTYYVRAYATNAKGTAYGNLISFTTTGSGGGPGTVVDYDGNVYPTVLIGNQEWMAENLKTTHYNNGSAIFHPTDGWSSVPSGTAAYTWYNNDPEQSYGALYNWDAAINQNGLCPTGWNVPTNDDWNQLITFLGGESAAGAKLKESGTTHWTEPNTGATNESGWTGLPGGMVNNPGFWNKGNLGYWWSATENYYIFSYLMMLSYENTTAAVSSDVKQSGFSVRCVRPAAQTNLPVLTTTSVSDITENSATSGGNVIEDGGAAVTQRGICWSNFPNPTIENSLTSDGTGTGSYVSQMGNLTPNTTYYARAYATNSVGTAYGNQVEFTTLNGGGGPGTVTDIDGNVYSTVIIGQQEWITENLKTTHYNDGTEIFHPTDGWSSIPNETGAYTWYDNDPAQSYGALYNWYAVNNGSGLCPPGWHVPAMDDYNQLITFLGGTVDAGGKLKETGTTHWAEPNTGATNESGWTGLPGGMVNNPGFWNKGNMGYWWSATEDYYIFSYRMGLSFDNASAAVSTDAKHSGFSVRCVRASAQAVLPTVTTSTVSEITNNTAVSGGEVTNDGGAEVTSRGVCWSTSPDPTLGGSYTSDGNGIGVFTSALNNLTANTTYYVRSYATNSIGTAYGNQVEFTTLNGGGGPGTVTDIDGNVYPIVIIGQQEWMAENLKTTHYSDGSEIYYPGSNGWSSVPNETGAYTWYDTDPAQSYGALYNWFAVNSTNGLCPSEWHVPTNDDYNQLFTFLGGTSEAGGKLKETGTEHWSAPNAGATNESGWTALPAGMANNAGFWNKGNMGYWWTATENYYIFSYSMLLSFDNPTANISSDSKFNGLSVRCVRGAQVFAPPTVTTSEIADSTITINKATLNGNVTSDGGSPVTNRGLCWNTTSNPVITDAHKTSGSGVGNFRVIAGSLTPNTTYYVRAFAENSYGLAYGNEVQFTTTGGESVTDIDGNYYPVVLIGSQYWMAENLKTTHYSDGASIDYPGADNSSWQNNTSGAYAWFDNDEAVNKDQYGGLYNWHAVNNSSGLCPQGWHVPASEEIIALAEYLNGTQVAGAKMKEAGFEHWNAPMTNPEAAGTNESGWTGLPGGYRYGVGTYYPQHNHGFWWTTTELPGYGTVYYFDLYSETPSVNLSDETKSIGMSVRCLKN